MALSVKINIMKMFISCKAARAGMTGYDCFTKTAQRSRKLPQKYIMFDIAGL